MIIRQHVPTYVDGYEAKQVEVNSVQELLGLPWVKAWADHCENAQFCVDGNTLLVDGIKDGKRWWWVIGYLDEVTGLPKWRPPSKSETL